MSALEGGSGWSRGSRLDSGHEHGWAERRLQLRAKRSWWQILRSTIKSLVSDRGFMAAAGCSFFATLALFPAITTLVSIYGLAFDPESVEQQLRFVRALLPPPAFQLIAERVHDLVTQPASQLGIKLLVGSAVTFWSAASGVKSMLSALNVAYNVEEERGFLRFQAVTLGITLAAMLLVVLGIAVLVFLPVVASFLGLAAESGALVHLAGIAMLLTFAVLSILVLYWIGPSRRTRTGQRIIPGVFAATLIWLLASALLNFYVVNISNLGATYGPIAAVVGIMLWFYMTVYAVLFGAELNAQLEAGG